MERIKGLGDLHVVVLDKLLLTGCHSMPSIQEGNVGFYVLHVHVHILAYKYRPNYTGSFKDKQQKQPLFSQLNKVYR